MNTVTRVDPPMTEKEYGAAMAFQMGMFMGIMSKDISDHDKIMELEGLYETVMVIHERAPR